jgi:hypothetical protein
MSDSYYTRACSNLPAEDAGERQRRIECRGVTLKLLRPGFGRRPSRLLHRQRVGGTAVLVRDSVLRRSFAAAAAPLRPVLECQWICCDL